MTHVQKEEVVHRHVTDHVPYVMWQVMWPIMWLTCDRKWLSKSRDVHKVKVKENKSENLTDVTQSPFQAQSRHDFV